jgi:hypothetical protein
MMYSANRTDLKNILQWLRGSDESQWVDQIRLLSETISQLKDLARQTTRTLTLDRPITESERFSPEATAINVAIPQLTKMLNTMHDHNRAAALDYGQAALELLLDD